MARREVLRADIQKRAEEILTGLNVPAQDAACVLDAIMDAEISGVESHGLMRLKPYADRIRQGTINPAPDIRTTVNGAAAHIDGGDGLGQVVMTRAVKTGLQLAREYGIGAVTVCRSSHFGTAAYYAGMMARAGCIGLAASVAGPSMAPFGGMDLLLGTNPFAIAFPGETGIFCGDMATSSAAKGKIRIYEKEGQSIPPGWALDQEGADTTDPGEALSGILLPMGGHKGYALAMAVDAVCALLSGASLSCESASVYSSAQPANTGHFAAAIDIAHFLPEEAFRARTQGWFDRLRASRPRSGFRIVIPGEPEAEKRAAAGETICVLRETLDMIEEYHQKYAQTK